MHKSIHYHLHCFRLIRRSISFPIAVTIASSYILPLFNYCNNLLFSLPAYKLIKLQRLQNYVVRCIHLLLRRSSDSITPLLKQLHWLPVYFLIKYKLSLVIHKCIHHNSPDYLASLLHLHTPTTPIHTRSSDPFSLLHTTYTTSTPPIYAHLPYLPLIIGTTYPITFEQDIKRHLKIYYFSHAFPPTQ